MNHSIKTKILSLLLAVIMVVGLLPVSVFATEADENAEMPVIEATEVVTESAAEEVTGAATEAPVLMAGVDSQAVEGFVSETHEVFSHNENTIAPGVTYSINYAYAKDGKQMVYYVSTADVTRDDVVVQTSYRDQYVDKKFGMTKLTEQVAYANALYTNPESDRYISDYYKVVAGVNASFYNMTTGQPSGVTYLDGVQIGESSSYNQFFAILKDGTAIVDYTKNLANYADNIWQACAGSQMLVWEGKDVTANASGSYNTDRHSRTCVGVTADGKVVVMSLDGRQEPFSCGGSMHELAQIMLEQGCVAAINLDGGGSTTFVARQAGEDEVQIVNRPSDGSERSISSGLLIASLAAPSNVFATAVLEAENTYVTPGSSVMVSAKGVSPAGTAAEIPANVTWQLADSAMGTVEDGLFVSSGVVGDAVVQMVYEGNVVGSTTINVVVPESLSFNSSAITVPFGKTVALDMTAVYGLNEVVLKEGDVVFALENNAIGTISGYSFTAAEASDVTASKITAQLAFDVNVIASSEINLGKGSEVVYDFEDGTTGGLKFSEPAGTAYNYVWPESEEWVVTAETGKVHSGTYAMAAHVNYSNSTESGYQKTSLIGGQDLIFDNATRVGMWIYIPDEAVGLWARWTIHGATAKTEEGYTWASINGQEMDTTAGGTGVVYSFQESGWHYLSINTSDYMAARLNPTCLMQFYVSDRDGSAYGYDASNVSNIIGDFTFYIDDITIDYSAAVDDREAPVFSSVVYADEFTNDAPELKGQTTRSNVLSFTATVADYVKSNASGLDVSTAKAYIDGKEVPFTYAGGKIAVVDQVLSDGVHTVKFSICDNMGNYGSVIRQINVNAGSGIDTVKLVPHDASLDRILHGSVYYMDLVATSINNVNSVSVTVDLDSLSTWELDHMDVTAGFEATYTIQEDENIATITITRTGSVEGTGEGVLVSIPVRVWQLKTGYVYPNGTKKGSQAYTAKQFRDMKEFWRISLIATVDCGVMTAMDGTVTTFTGERVFVDTEAWAEDADMIATTAGTEYYNSWNGGHVHSAVALEDKVATCSEAGYIGRTFCAGCNSVVEWGATIPATGHTYEMTDGVLKCCCGATFTGVWTDGRTYENGIVITNGWNGDTYYVDGERLTGIQKVTAPDGSGEYYYDFGTDGICDNRVKYTGLFMDEENGVYRYSKLGIVTSGWNMINNEWYYFNPETEAAVSGNFTIDYVTYLFEETGRLTSGVWITNSKGTKYSYGPAQYYTGWEVIDGKTYYFDKAYRYEGYRYVVESNSKIQKWFDFGTDGALVGELDYTGLLVTEIGTYYLKDGVSQQGLFYVDGFYYYFPSATLSAYKNGTYSIANNNGLDLPLGTYSFDEEGRIILRSGIMEEDGVLYYYENDVRTHAGLIMIGADYYYVKTGGIVVTGQYYVSNTNGLMEMGYYEFGADGKMKNGIINEDGTLYYYVNGNRANGGLMMIDGGYYYVRSNCQVAVGTYYVSNTNDLLPAGNYTFGADGKMIDGIVEIDGVRYYYVNGNPVAAGMIQIGNDYYYVRTGGKLATGYYYCNTTNGLLEKGYYNFDEEGKLKNGIVDDEGTLYYYVMGHRASGGLLLIDGDYYYVRSNSQIVTGSYYCNNTNGLLPAGTYEFGADGKMLNGIHMVDGTLYYYVNGVRTAAGMIELNGNYYYVRTSGQLAIGYYYCNTTNGLMPAGFYTFDVDGSMIK